MCQFCQEKAHGALKQLERQCLVVNVVIEQFSSRQPPPATTLSSHPSYVRTGEGRSSLKLGVVNNVIVATVVIQFSLILQPSGSSGGT